MQRGWVWAAAVFVIGGCGSGVEETAAGTEIVHYTLADARSETATARATHDATPARVSETVQCRDAELEIAFARREHPESGSLFFDDLRVTVREANDAAITARVLNVENRGSEERTEMALPIVVRVDRGRTMGECSYLIRAGSPAVTAL